MSKMLSGFLASDSQEDGNTDVNAMQIVGPAQKENVSVSSTTSTLHSQQIKLQLQSWCSTTNLPWQTTVKQLSRPHHLRSRSCSAIHRQPSTSTTALMCRSSTIMDRVASRPSWTETLFLVVEYFSCQISKRGFHCQWHMFENGLFPCARTNKRSYA